MKIEPLNKNHGRRSSDIGGWGQQLLKLLEDDGFSNDSKARQVQRMDRFQASIAEIIRRILDADPSEARVKGKTAEVIVRDILKQADEKGKSGEVAQYLVGAKLMIRLNQEASPSPATPKPFKLTPPAVFNPTKSTVVHTGR